jgi:nitric oxide reductase activation protein
LIDEDYPDDQPWVCKARRMFFGQSDDWEDQSISRTLGSLLGNDLEEMRDRFDFRTYVVEPAYRDDNVGLWDFGNRGQPGQEDEARHQAVRRSGRTGVQVRDEEEPEESPAGAPEDVELARPQQQRQSVEEPLSSPIRYDEWDYLVGRERPYWCTLLEKSAPEGDARQIEQVLDRNRELVNRVKVLVRAVQVQRPERLKRRFDGDRLDLDAGIGATIDLRSGVPPDPRVYSILGRRQRDLSVLVLLDLSQSTNDVAPGAGTTVLELAREATALLADAMDRIGDSFAIHGFASNGRHDVGYFRIKDFGQPYDDLARSRLAGMTGQLSTRMGTALRHAGSCLKNRRAHRKLVLLITDGEPSDIDVHDSQYLVLDARKAVEENLRQGIYTYCMSLDPKADRYVSRIFGIRNWTVVDHLRRLPEKLPLLYMRLTH